MDFLNKICYLPLNLYYINGIILRTIINYLVFKFINFLISIKCTDEHNNNFKYNILILILF